MTVDPTAELGAPDDAGTSAGDDLSEADVIEAGRAAHIRQVLAGRSWRWLTEVVRRRWETDLSRRHVTLDLATMDDNQLAAMADFLDWPTHRTGTAKVKLLELDRRLRQSSLSTGLATCLTVSGGQLRDAAGTRRIEQQARDDALVGIWTAAQEHAALTVHPDLKEWLLAERTSRRLPADPIARQEHLRLVLVALNALPHDGTGLARFATEVYGRAHALDRGPVPAAILRAIARLTNSPAPETAAERRALWARMGIAMDSVSSTVLVHALTLPGDGPISEILTAAVRSGVPARLTLGQIRHYVERRQPPGHHPVVYVCENPSVVESAAEALHGDCAPMVCVEGHPSVAANLLLSTLRQAGAHLRYHGDFDWAGLAIASDMIASGATPWRFSAIDYCETLATPHAELPPLRDRPGTSAAWDPQLVPAMTTHAVAVEEEHVIQTLIGDLCSKPRACGHAHPSR